MAAIELGVPYYMYTPGGGSYVCFNDPSDSNFVGYCTDITGLDDAGVRENAQPVVAGDGGYHGPFWRDRRPWTMAGVIMPQFPILSRDAAQEALEGVVGQAMQSDGYMRWTPADGVQKQIYFRKQQPVRITSGQSNVQKNFQIALVSADYRIYAVSGGALVLNSSVSWTGNATNSGNADSPIKATIQGPVSGTMTLTDNTTGKRVTILTGLSISNTGNLVLDFTGSYPTLFDNFGNNLYGYIDPINTNWDIAVAGTKTVTSGINNWTFSASGTTSSSSCMIQWNNAWL